MTEDKEWSLKGHKLYFDNERHWNDDYPEDVCPSWYYSREDIDTLREMLIEDIWELVSPKNRYCECKSIIKSEVEYIINKRFGVEG